MRRFEEIYAIAAERHGGDAALREKIGNLADPSGLTDDRVLAQFSRSVFCAGFN